MSTSIALASGDWRSWQRHERELEGQPRSSPVHNESEAMGAADVAGDISSDVQELSLDLESASAVSNESRSTVERPGNTTQTMQPTFSQNKRNPTGVVEVIPRPTINSGHWQRVKITPDLEEDGSRSKLRRGRSLKSSKSIFDVVQESKFQKALEYKHSEWDLSEEASEPIRIQPGVFVQQFFLHMFFPVSAWLLKLMSIFDPKWRLILIAQALTVSNKMEHKVTQLLTCYKFTD
jgi:hypothetical protein